MTNQQILNALNLMYGLVECFVEEGEPILLEDGTDVREAVKILTQVLTRDEPIV